MTYPDPDPRLARPIEVEVKNWPDNGAAKPPPFYKTTVKTYVLDPAGVAGVRNVQICDYEPNRARMVITVLDAEMALLTSQPVSSPDATSPSIAPASGGAVVAVYQPLEIYGSDAFWLNCLNAVGRVSVIKEYRA